MLRVICIKMVTKMMTVDEAFKVLGVRNKLLGSRTEPCGMEQLTG